MLHDPGAALGAEDAAVHGMVAVALDIGDLPGAVGLILHVDVDAAAAGAHVAGRLADFVGDLGGEVQDRLVHVLFP